MRGRLLFALGSCLCLALPGCELCRAIGFAPVEVDPESLARNPVPDEPAHVTVQHVLISFEGAGVPSATRSKEDAERVAQKVLADARSGRDFDELVRLYTDDRGSGVLAIANWGVLPGLDETERRKLVRGFTAEAFRLAPGEVGLVAYDATNSPYGWHVVKRLK